jgi:hypothetical protein
VVARPCEASWELAFSGIVCVAPLRLGGLRGKKSTPSIGWEVPVRSQRLASRSWIIHSSFVYMLSLILVAQ